MKNYLQTFLDMRDENFLRTHTQAIMRLELPGTNKDKHKASDYIYELMKANGLDAERIDLVADGKTVCHDKIMPMCWDASMGRLTVLSDWEGDPVVADYDRHPFHLIQYSTAVAEGGVTAKLVPYERMLAGEDATGAMILLPYGLIASEETLVPSLDRGAIGLVNCTASLAAPEAQAADSLMWANNCTETLSWHVTAGERPFVSFCVTPATGRQLQEACQKGEVLVRVECDGRRFEGTLPAVTGLLKGESPREFWMIAHNGEPLEDDNNSGVVACISAMMQIKKAVEEKKIPPLKYSLRVVFATELYGNAAMAVRFGGSLRERCIGAICVDGMPIAPTVDGVLVRSAPAPIPFYGNALLRAAWDELNNTAKEPPFVAGWDDYWCSDCFMSDPTVGLPTVTSYKAKAIFWHNSVQKENYIDYRQFKNVTAVFTAFTASVIAPDAAFLHRFLPLAAANAIRKLSRTAQTVPPRKGTDAAVRLKRQLEVELADLRAFEIAGAQPEDIRQACDMVSAYAAVLEPVQAAPADEATPVFDSLVKYVPYRTSVGVPNDLARLPMRMRNRPMVVPLMRRVFAAMDGVRDLRELVIEAEFEENRQFDEQTLKTFAETIELLEEYEYIGMVK